MENKFINDSNLKASSEQHDHPVHHGRIGHWGAWCAGIRDQDQWLQIDMGHVLRLVFMKTQGNGRDAWVKSFYLQFSPDNMTWYCYGTDEIFLINGNSDPEIDRFSSIIPAIITRYIRVNPYSWEKDICLRLELYGCPPTVNDTDLEVPGKIMGPACRVERIVHTTQPLPPTTTPIPLIPISNLRIRISRYIETNMPTLVTMYPHFGTSPNYHWSMGNGANVHTVRRSFFFIYKVSGVYMVKLRASNEINNQTVNTTVIVQNAISGLRYLSAEIGVVPASVVEIAWELQQGTNVTYTLDFGDGSNKVILRELGLGRHHMKHNYTKVGNFRPAVAATNLVGRITIVYGNVFVERPISGLISSVRLPRGPKRNATKYYICVGEEITVTVRILTGTSAVCRYKYGDSVTLMSSNKHRYARKGSFTLIIICSNHVNSQSIVSPEGIVVQGVEVIEDLSVKGQPVAYGNPVFFFLQMSKGTGFLCSWNFGDGSTLETDFSDLGLSILHNYSAIGDYNVFVNCDNVVGIAHARMTAHVHIRIKGLQITNTERYIASNVITSFNVTLASGSHVLYRVDFQDGKVLFITEKSVRNQWYMTVRHSFSVPGVYQLSVSASNSLGKVNASIKESVTVQNPIRNMSLISNTPVKEADGVIKYRIIIVENVPLPTNVTCIWDFGDESTKLSPLELHQSLSQEESHLYLAQGAYATNVTCSNNVSSTWVSTVAHVHKVIKPRSSAGVNISDMSCTEVKTLIHPCYFSFGNLLYFTVTSQAYDVSYLWTIEGDNVTYVFQEDQPALKHTFSKPGVFNVTVNIYNILFKMSSSLIVDIQQKIIGVNLSSDNFTFLRSFTVFNIKVQEFGTNSCFVLDYNDGSKKTIFGGYSCETFADRLVSIHWLTTNSNIIHNHTYQMEGNYSISLYGFNKVSSVRRRTSVIVKKPICKVYYINITNKNESKVNTSLVFTYSKATGFAFQFLHKLNCVLADRIQLRWIMWKISSARQRSLINVHTYPSTPAFLNVLPRSLDYADYQLEAEVNPYGSDITLLYSNVQTTESIHVRIVPSEMVAVISGGTSRSIGYDSILTLDGSESYDPDVGKGRVDRDLIFTWFCKTAGNDDQSGYTGCFNSNYSIPFSSQKLFSMYTTTLVQNAIYRFQLMISKYGRRAFYNQSVLVVVGAPPSMEIRCKINCKELLIPSIKLALSSACTDCLPTSILLYRWKIDAQNTDGAWFSVSLPPTYTSTGTSNANLITLPNFLSPGVTYRFHLNAWRTGGNSGTAEVTMKTNTGPTSGSCAVSPSTGYAMSTRFRIHCYEWKDPDVPLRYRFLYKNGKDTNILYSGSHTDTTSQLPLGTSDANSTLTIVVEVGDSLGSSTHTSLLVVVKRPKQIDYGSLMTNIDNVAANKENKHRALQQVTIIGSFLNSLADDTNSQAGNGGSGITGSGNDGGVGGINGGSGGSGGGSAGAGSASGNSGSGIAGGSNGGGSGSTGSSSSAGNGGGSSGVNNGNNGGSSGSSGGGGANIGSGGSSSDEVAKQEQEKARRAREAAKKKRMEIRERILVQVSMIPVSSVADLELTSNAVKAVTQKPDELSRSAQVAGMECLSNMAAVLARVAHKETSGDKVETVGRSILASLASIINVILNSDVTIYEEREKIRNLTKKASQILNDISTSVFYHKVTEDYPTVMNTSHVTLVLDRNDVLSVSGKEFELARGQFRTCTGVEMMPGRSSKTIVDVQIIEFPHNIFIYSNSPETVSSLVIAMKFQDDKGKKINVKNLDNDIQVTVGKRKEISNQINSTAFQYNLAYSRKEKIRVHQFDRKRNESSITVELTTTNDMPNMEWMFLVQYGQRPSLDAAALNLTVKPLAQGGSQIYFYRVFLEDEVLNTSGYYFVGIVPIVPEIYWKQWLNGSISVSYSLIVHEAACYYWNDVIEKWKTDGCRVGNRTRPASVQCLCNHLTAFGTSLFVLPNTIVFAEALHEFTKVSRPPLVFPVIMSLFGCYLVILIWARREDLRDDKRAETFSLEDNCIMDQGHYEVTLHTGLGKDAGTTSTVFCTLEGEYEKTTPRCLSDPSRVRFKRAAEDSFYVTTREPLGKLSKLNIWHSDSGANPSWFLSKVIVSDLIRGQSYLFLCDRWLAVEHDDGEVGRTLYVAKKEDAQQFRQLFTSNIKRTLVEHHIWLSVLLRPARSSFTRIQRLSCCLALLYCAVLASVFICKLFDYSDDIPLLTIQPFRLMPRDIYNGFLIGLTFIPLSLIIASTFRSIERKPKKLVTLFNETSNSNEEIPARMNQEVERQVLDDSFDDILKWLDDSHDTTSLDERVNLETTQKLSTSNCKVNEGFTDSILVFETEEEMMDKLSTCDYDNRPTHRMPYGNKQPGERAFKYLDTSPDEDESTKLEKFIIRNYANGSKRLPYWCVAFAWLFLASIIVASAFFAIVYGLQFENEIPGLWIASVAVAFLVDLVLSQTVKVLLLSLFITLTSKRDNEQHEDITLNFGNMETLGNYDNGQGLYVPTMAFRSYNPSPGKIEHRRRQRVKEVQMTQLLKELMVYVMFLGCLAILGLGHRDPVDYTMVKGVKDAVVRGTYLEKHLTQGDWISKYWTKINETFVAALSSSSRQREICSSAESLIIDCSTLVIGAVRLRQLRVTPGQCTIKEDFRELINECNGVYSWSTEDKGKYLPGWKNDLQNSSQDAPAHEWQYRTSSELQVYPYVGNIETYFGGGYIVEINGSSHEILNELQNKSWIGRYTRAVFAEANLFNAQVNLFVSVTLLSEWLPTNDVIFIEDVKTARLYRRQDDLYFAMIGCELITMIFLVCFIYKEVKKFCKLRRQYLKDHWNWLEVIILALIIVFCALLMLRDMKKTASVESAKRSSHKEAIEFVNLYAAAAMDELLTCCLGLLIFFSNLKLLKLMRFNHRIFVLAKTLAIAAPSLLSFLVVFFVVYIGYSSFYNLTMGNTVKDYRSFIVTLETLLCTLLGGFEYNSMVSKSGLLGPIFFFSFMIFVVMVLMNIFLATIVNAFVKVRADKSLKDNEIKLMEFVIKKIKEKLGFKDMKTDPNDNEGFMDQDEYDLKCNRTPSEHNMVTRSPESRETVPQITIECADEDQLEDSSEFDMKLDFSLLATPLGSPMLIRVRETSSVIEESLVSSPRLTRRVMETDLESCVSVGSALSRDWRGGSSVSHNCGSVASQSSGCSSSCTSGIETASASDPDYTYVVIQLETLVRSFIAVCLDDLVEDQAYEVLVRNRIFEYSAP